MSDLSAAALAMYVSVALIKAYLFMRVYPWIVAGIVRTHWRKTGSVTSRYFVWVAIAPAVMGFAVAAVWPLLLPSEGRRLLRPYNAFGVARDCMRATAIPHDKQ